MTTHVNRFGETVTKWDSHKHPDNPDFMQVVHWTVWEKPDGRVTLGYSLDHTTGKMYFLYNLTKQQAIDMYGEE